MVKGFLQGSLFCGGALWALSFGLAGCTMYEPDHFSTSTIQLEEQQVSQNMPVSQFSEQEVQALATHFRRHAEGPLELTVVYDPRAHNNGPIRAGAEAARLAKTLRKAGVADVHAGIMPVMDTGEAMKVLLSYTAYNALAPEDCTMMPGFENRTVENDPDYKLGCTFDTVFTRQIANPKDLKGQETDGPSDGRRASNIVDVYRTGAPNKPLEGEGASGE